MEKQIVVGMSECKVSQNPVTLVCIGLGSCVAVALYDSIHRVGGLVHIMLPTATGNAGRLRPAKFADTGIEFMLKRMAWYGCHAAGITAKIFGGATVLVSREENSAMSIGRRNIEAVRKELAKRNIRIVHEEVGGSSGRTIIFNIENGSVTIRKAGGSEKEC